MLCHPGSGTGFRSSDVSFVLKNKTCEKIDSLQLLSGLRGAFHFMKLFMGTSFTNHNPVLGNLIIEVLPDAKVCPAVKIYFDGCLMTHKLESQKTGLV